MLRSIYASNRPIVLPGLLLPVLVVAALAGMRAEPREASLAGPIYDVLFAPVHAWPVLSLVLGGVVLLVGALLVNAIYNEHEFADRVNYLPAFVYVSFGISVPEWMYFNPILLANVFVLFSLRRLFRIYRIANPTSMLFDAGLLMGLAVLIYPPLALLLLYLWVGMTQLRTGSLREWLIPLSGILVPALYVAAAYWWVQSFPDLEEFMDFQGRFSLGPDREGSAGTSFVAMLSFTALVCVLGAGKFISGLSGSTVHRKNTKRSFLWLSGFMLLVFIYTGLLEHPDVGSAALLAIPVAVLSAKWYSADGPWWLVSLPFYTWLALVLLHLGMRFMA